MQYTVKNDTPFQILTSAIVIGPSQTGYVLEVAADGKNFSPLFTVGANVTRQVTNLSSGAYYRLSGNVGDVVVNWVRSCVTEGGSGGSGATYTAGTYIDITQDVISVTGITPDLYLTSADTENFATKQYVDEAVSGKSDAKILVDFDHTSQAERASVYADLYALYSGGSGSSINKLYDFYKTVNTWQGLKIDYYGFSGDTVVFGKVVSPENTADQVVYEQVLTIDSAGTVNVVTNSVGGGPDLSAYYTSAQTEEKIASAASITYASAVSYTDAALSAFTPAGNYVERAESESTLIIPTNINDNENDAYIGTFEDGFAYKFQIGNERLANIHNTQIDEDGNVTGHRFANEEYPTKEDLNWNTNSLKPIVLEGPQYDMIPEEPGAVVPTMRYEGIYWDQTNGYHEYEPTSISLWFDSGATFTHMAYPADEENILRNAERIGDINYIAGWNGAENVIIYNEIYGFVDKTNPGDNYVAVKTRYCDATGTEIASGFTDMLIEDGAEEWHTFDVGDGYNYGIYFNVLEDSENNRLEVVFKPSEGSSQYEGEDFFETYRIEVNINQPDGTNSYFDGLKYFDPDSGDWEDINKSVQDQIDTMDEVVSAALVDLNEKKVESEDVKHIVKLTQAEYDQLVLDDEVDPYTFYIIVNSN